jgi:hypothetical protein
MAIVSVTEASKLTGKSIPTLYRHIKTGFVSKTNDGIETSELMRVYGALRSDNHSSHQNENQELSFLKREIEMLKSEVETLKRDKQDASKREERLFYIIENRLPAPDSHNSYFGKIKELFSQLRI